MARPMRRDAQADFRGGLNLAADPLQLNSNEVRRADEAVLTEYGGITKRYGSQRLSNTPLHANGILNGFGWEKNDGTQQLLAVANGTLYTAPYAIGTTWTARTGALSTTVAPSMVSFRDASREVVYIADGGLLNKWTDFGATPLEVDLTNTASTRVLAVYNQRLFGISGTNQTLYWSAINNGDSLGYAPSGGGEAIIRTFSDQILTGLAAFRSSLLVFHTSGISRFTGLTQDDIVISAGTQGVTSDVGTIAARSVVQTEQGVFFLSDRGFYVATESDVQPLSFRLDPLVRDLLLTQASGVIGVHARATKEVLWFLPAVGILRYSYALNAWTGPCAGGYLAPATRALFEAQDTDKQPIVLAGDASGYVKQVDAPRTYTDNAAVDGTGGSSYTFAVTCRRFYAGDPSNVKSFKWAYLMTDLRGSAAASVLWESTSGGGSFTLPADTTARTWDATLTWPNPPAGSDVWPAASSGTQPERVPLGAQGQYLDITIIDNSPAASLWSRVELECFDYGRRY